MSETQKTWLQRAKEKIFGAEPIYIYIGNKYKNYKDKKYKYKEVIGGLNNWYGNDRFGASVGTDLESNRYTVIFSPVNKKDQDQDIEIEVSYNDNNVTVDRLIKRLIENKQIKVESEPEPEPQQQLGGKRKPKTKKSKKTNKKHRKTQRK